VYASGLRSQEVRNLKWSDIDYDRKRIHIRQTKYNKDRYVPLSIKMIKGLKKYKTAYSPSVYVFNGMKHSTPLSSRGVQWAMKETLKSSGIQKEATIHTLRHSFATHLLEMGMDLDTLRHILGHAHLTTTMIYLHIPRIGKSEVFSPFDRIY
jgi:integrase